VQFALVWILGPVQSWLVDKFCCLGDVLSVDGIADAAVEARIRIGWNKFRQLVPLLTNKDSFSRSFLFSPPCSIIAGLPTVFQAVYTPCAHGVRELCTGAYPL